MSMLAEPRRKKRSINLRGKNNWSDDPNKFGQKMMQKMGWTPGKGLGMNEDGAVNHVKVRFKDDNGGVGFKDVDNQWTEHDSNFEELLKQLHGGAVDNTKLHSESSLEEKSKKLQSRLHYKKFTRGKDITRYSHKDLANIFGKKSLHKSQESAKCEEVTKDIKNQETEKILDPDLKLVEGGCMKEYFQAKFQSKVRYNDEIDNCDSKKTYSYEEDSVAFKGFTSQRDEIKKCAEINTPIISASFEVSKTMYSNFTKASENLAGTLEAEKNVSASFEITKKLYSNFTKGSENLPGTLDVENDSVIVKRKKKKLKKGKDCINDDSIIVDNVSDKMFSPAVEIPVEHENSEHVLVKLSKKQKRKLKKLETIDRISEINNLKSNKKKKKKSQNPSPSDEFIHVTEEESVTKLIQTYNCKESKKSKISNQNETNGSSEKCYKKKRKLEVIVDLSEDIEEGDISVSKKKKKSKKNNNPADDDIHETIEVESTKKSKKKKK